MTVIRTEDYQGGIRVWDDQDPDTPVFFSSGSWTQTAVDGVVSARQTAAAKEALLNRMYAAEARIHEKIDELFADARQYVEDNYPSVTADQLKTAFVNQIKTWVAAWSGD